MFVKVCGLSTPESVRSAAEAGADAVGFVLTRSPREVTPDQVRELLFHVPAGAGRGGSVPARTGRRRRRPRPGGGPGLGPAPRGPLTR